MKSYTIQRDAMFVDDFGDVFELRKGDTFELLNEYDDTPHIKNRHVAAASGSTLIGIGKREKAFELLSLCAEAPHTPEPPCFVPGDLVQLVSGGLKLTVSALRTDANGREWVDVVWFEAATGGLGLYATLLEGVSGPKLMRQPFDARMLRKVEPLPAK